MNDGRPGSDRLRVEVLGPLRVLAGAREIVLGPPKQQAAFLALALQPGTVASRDDLIDRIWGERAPVTASGSVHTYVSGLRRVLADLGSTLLESTSAGYRLHLEPEALDLAVVERLDSHSRAARSRGDWSGAWTALEQALGRWRAGAALAGLPGPFAAQQRARLSGLRLRLLVDHAEVLLECGRPTEFAQSADRLAAEVGPHPFDERLRRALISTLHRSGRTADALAHYHSLRQVLADELGIDPSAATQAVHAQVLTEGRGRCADPPAIPPTNRGYAPGTDGAAPAVRPPTGPAQLPHDTVAFVGRSEQVADVLRYADVTGGNSPSIVSVVGVGGVGKTTLAVRCGHLLRESYPDGQLHIDLRGFGPSQQALAPAAALQQLLASVGVAKIPPQHEQRVALWRSTVAGRRMLLLLDNARSAEQVEDLLPGTGTGFVLVTSRNRLAGLSVRHGAHRVTLAPLSETESLDLLARSAGADRVAAEAGAARRLVELCDRLPLALRVAAEHLVSAPTDSVSTLVGQVENVHHRLDALQLTDDELCSVRAVLSWSVNALPPEAAEAFGLLGSYAGVSATTAAAVALLDLTPEQARSRLATLEALHLVDRAGDRYRMHDLTRLYAEEVSRRLPEPVRLAARDRVLDWYIAGLDARPSGSHKVVFRPPPTPYPLPVFADQSDFLRWCGNEWPNLSALVRQAQRTGRHESAWQLAYQLFDFFYATGRAVDWLDLLRMAMRSADILGDRAARAALLNQCSVAHSRLGQNDVAVAELQEALDLSADPEQWQSRIALLGNLASTLREAKRYDEALAPAQEALALAERSGIAYYLGACHDVLCELYAEQEQWSAALRHTRPGIEQARACGSLILEANLLITKAHAHHGLGERNAAGAGLRAAIALSERAGDRYHEALALYGLARVSAWRSGPGQVQALELGRRALARFRDLEAEEAGEVQAFLAELDGEVPDLGASVAGVHGP